MEHTRHLGARVPIRAGKRHRESVFNRIGRNAKVVVTCGELAVKIDSELVRCLCRQVDICCGGPHSSQQSAEWLQDQKAFHASHETLKWRSLRRYFGALSQW